MAPYHAATLNPSLPLTTTPSSAPFEGIVTILVSIFLVPLCCCPVDVMQVFGEIGLRRHRNLSPVTTTRPAAAAATTTNTTNTMQFRRGIQCRRRRLVAANIRVFRIRVAKYCSYCCYQERWYCSVASGSVGAGGATQDALLLPVAR